jgi:hypothetical protein
MPAPRMSATLALKFSACCWVTAPGSLHGVVLTRAPDILTDGHTPTLETAKAEFKRSRVSWREWSELGAPDEILS